MGDKKRILFIINPIAGTGKQHKTKTIIEQFLDKETYDYEIVYTEYAGHASEIAKKAISDRIDIIAAVGGDGSVNEIAKCLIYQTTTLAIIPMGSGNGLARHLNIPLRQKEAIKKINNFSVSVIDSASINEHTFFNVAGLGFDALVSKRFANSTKRGLFSYLKIIISEFKKYKPDEYRLNIDGLEINTPAFLIAVANSSQYGNNTIIAPLAQTNDGLLDICILKPFPFSSIPYVLFNLIRKRVHLIKFSEVHQGKNISISQQKLSAHFDGEPFDSKNVEILIRPLSLKVLT